MCFQAENRMQMLWFATPRQQRPLPSCTIISKQNAAVWSTFYHRGVFCCCSVAETQQLVRFIKSGEEEEENLVMSHQCLFSSKGGTRSSSRACPSHHRFIRVADIREQRRGWGLWPWWGAARRWHTTVCDLKSTHIFSQHTDTGDVHELFIRWLKFSQLRQSNQQLWTAAFTSSLG